MIPLSALISSCVTLCMPRMPHQRCHRAQGGGALLVVLVFIATISVLTVQMVSSQQMEERTTVRVKQKILSNETAYGALAVAEALVYKLSLGIKEAPVPLADLSAITQRVSSGDFFVWDDKTLENVRKTSTSLYNPSLNIGQQRDAWWSTYGMPIDALYDQLKLSEAARPDLEDGEYVPRYLFEEIAQDIGVSQSTQQSVKVYYRITVRTGHGPTRSTVQVVRDSTFIY